MKNIILIGIGPHAKKIYIKLLKKHNLIPKLIVDLDINETSIKEYLKEEKLGNIDTYFVSSFEANLNTLSVKVKTDLKKLMKKYEITHAIISTEPKAHLAYAKFLIQNNINILMDKPITLPCNVLNKVKEARKIEK